MGPAKSDSAKNPGAGSAGHPLNRLMEVLVRSKKRLAPNFELEKIPLYAPLKRWLFGRLREKQVIVHGFPIELDPLDSLELSIFRSYEPFETELLAREIRQGMRIIDVGANIGYYTLLFSKLTGRGGQVFSFEPEPQNFELLRRNVTRNSRSNVTLINKAASDHSGSSFLYLSTENLGDHQVYAGDGSRRRVAIEMVRIDEAVPGAVDLIKMDVQGFEFHALAGMEQTIASSPSLILFTEFWPEGLRRAGSNPGEFLQCLRDWGFEIEYINEYANRLEPANDADLLQRYALPEAHTNLLCRKTRPA